MHVSSEAAYNIQVVSFSNTKECGAKYCRASEHVVFGLSAADAKTGDGWTYDIIAWHKRYAPLSKTRSAPLFVEEMMGISEGHCTETVCSA